MAIDRHRIIVKTQITDSRLPKPIEAGEIILSDYDLTSAFFTDHKDSFVEVPMTDEEWVVYMSSEVNKSYRKVMALNALCETNGLEVELPSNFELESTSLRAAVEGKILDPSLYGGVKDIVTKASEYNRKASLYEEKVLSSVVNSKTK